MGSLGHGILFSSPRLLAEDPLPLSEHHSAVLTELVPLVLRGSLMARASRHLARRAARLRKQTRAVGGQITAGVGGWTFTDCIIQGSLVGVGGFTLRGCSA